MTSPYIPQPPRLDDTPIVRYLVEIWKKLGRKGAVLGSLKFGQDDSYTEFEDDGTIVFKGNATVWNDINFKVSNLRPGATSPTWGAVFPSGSHYGYLFANGRVESLHGAERLLHGYKEGTDITLHIEWLPSTNGAGSVRWGMEYVWLNPGDTFSTSTTIYKNVSTPATAWKTVETDFATISGTGKKIGSIFIVRFFRDGTHISDTYLDTAYPPQFGIHYEIDTIGSRELATK